MLNSKLALHDVEDVEALAKDVIRKSGLTLDAYAYEDLLAYLVETAWELSIAWEPARVQPYGRFSHECYRRLALRVTDWHRRRNGRTRWQFSGYVHERTIPTVVPLEDRGDGADDCVALDLAERGLSVVLGLQRTRSSQGAGTYASTTASGHGRAA